MRAIVAPAPGIAEGKTLTALKISAWPGLAQTEGSSAQLVIDRRPSVAPCAI
jgi:hypothetical protein